MQGQRLGAVFNQVQRAEPLRTAQGMGRIAVADASTGAVLAKVPLPGMTYGGVAIAGGYVFAAVGTQSSSGYIAAYRADPPAVP